MAEKWPFELKNFHIWQFSGLFLAMLWARLYNLVYGFSLMVYRSSSNPGLKFLYFAEIWPFVHVNFHILQLHTWICTLDHQIVVSLIMFHVSFPVMYLFLHSKYIVFCTKFENKKKTTMAPVKASTSSLDNGTPTTYFINIFSYFIETTLVIWL